MAFCSFRQKTLSPMTSVHAILNIAFILLLFVFSSSVDAFTTTLPIQKHVNPTTLVPYRRGSPFIVQQAPWQYSSDCRPIGQTVLFMGWGPDPIWSTAEVISNESANQSGQSVMMTLKVPQETVSEYKIPGQYVQIRLNEETKPLFLAIASPPTDTENNIFEFLIKKTPDNTWMTNAPPGTTLEISQVLGNGFPMAENLEGFKYDFPTQNVLLFAAGSGIAPIRAAIESGQLGVANSGTGGRTARLYYGVRNEQDLCFVDKFAEWEGSGCEVVPVLSQPGDGWAGRTGYVQNCLEEDGVPIPRNSGALLCGMKGMADSVTDILTKAGVFDGRVLTNF